MILFEHDKEKNEVRGEIRSDDLLDLTLEFCALLRFLEQNQRARTAFNAAAEATINRDVEKFLAGEKLVQVGKA